MSPGDGPVTLTTSLIVSVLTTGVHVQPRILHVNACSDAIENVTLMYCPPDRRVKVEVPLKVGPSSIPCHAINARLYRPQLLSHMFKHAYAQLLLPFAMYLMRLCTVNSATVV